MPDSCEDELVDMLGSLAGGAHDGGRPDDPEASLNVEQNAAVAEGAERYYRTMVRGGAASWNVRDRHMTDTLDRLMAHHGPDAKAIVWAHNTHVGDARATDMTHAGMFNVGQLARERHPDAGVVIVGFGGYQGSVMAAGGWGEPMRRLPVPPARADSVEALLHQAGCDRGLYVFPEAGRPEWLRTARAQRAIGVVYDPERERGGNYVPTVLGERYDAFCHFDETEAIEPLRREAAQPAGEYETYPHGR